MNIAYVDYTLNEVMRISRSISIVGITFRTGNQMCVSYVWALENLKFMYHTFKNILDFNLNIVILWVKYCEY